MPFSTRSARASPSCSSSRLPSSTSSSSGIVHSSSPSKAKYSRPTLALLTPSGTIHGLQDVDPVVGEQVLAVDDQADREEVAVAQALRRADDLGAGRRLGQADGAA